MKRTTTWVAMLIAVGCASDPQTAQLEVQMLSIDGEVHGATLPGAVSATSRGERSGDQGTFFVEGPDLSVQLSACPLGDLENTDPYGTGGVGPIGIGIVESDAGVDAITTGIIAGLDCPGRGLTLCSGRACGVFSSDQVDLTIIEENGWRHVTATADAEIGSVVISLRYRERH